MTDRGNERPLPERRSAAGSFRTDAAKVARLLAVGFAIAPALVGCGRGVDSAGDLRAQRVVLAREVEGLHAIVERLERGEPLLPEGDLAVAVDDTLIRELIGAQLPVDADVERFHVTLRDADVQFSGSPTLQLRGRLQLREQPDVTAAVTVFGALDDIRIDRTSSTLRAALAADHLSIEQATGLAQYLSGATLDELARRIRLAIAAQLPVLEIPIAVRQTVELPALTEGPVRVAGGRLPLEVAVSQVVAARGRLWLSIRVTPGQFDPLPADASAESRR